MIRCITRSKRCSSALRRTKTTRTKGPRDRSKGRPAAPANKCRRLLGFPSLRGMSLRSSNFTSSPPSPCTTAASFPCTKGKTVWRIVWRRIMVLRAWRSASTSSRPFNFKAKGKLLAGFSGWSCCKNHKRSWAQDKRASASPGGWGWVSIISSTYKISRHVHRTWLARWRGKGPRVFDPA